MEPARRVTLVYLLWWFVLALVAVGNGALREALLADRLAERTAHQLSTLTLVLATGLVTAWLARRVRPRDDAQAWRLGLAWLVLTLAFECGFGRWVAGHSWERLLADYDLAAGRLWPLFLAWVLVLPRLARELGRRWAARARGAAHSERRR